MTIRIPRMITRTSIPTLTDILIPTTTSTPATVTHIRL